jgi:hypothetical protein
VENVATTKENVFMNKKIKPAPFGESSNEVPLILRASLIGGLFLLALTSIFIVLAVLGDRATNVMGMTTSELWVEAATSCALGFAVGGPGFWRWLRPSDWT